MVFGVIAILAIGITILFLILGWFVSRVSADEHKALKTRIASVSGEMDLLWKAFDTRNSINANDHTSARQRLNKLETKNPQKKAKK